MNGTMNAEPTQLRRNGAARISRFGKLVGGSLHMRAVYDMIEKAARLDVPVLITGETGTGKELVAGEIQARGKRKDAPFVTVNTGALSTDLVTSELFGHVKGAFTGAVANKTGRIAEARGGTLFLDEIATMDDRVQVALLRVLENHVYRPVGAREDAKATFRLIAASNTDLNRAIEEGSFRGDLLYRLQVFQIGVPPLRHRREDIPMLTRHFIEMFSTELDLDVTGVADNVLQLFDAYPWPGNVRELKNVIAQGVVLAEHGALTPSHLPARITTHLHATGLSSPMAERQNLSSSAKLSGPRAEITSPTDTGPDQTHDGVFFPLGGTLDDLQRVYVMKTLAHCAYNKTQTARKLGLSRKTLYDKLNRWEKTDTLKRSVQGLPPTP